MTLYRQRKNSQIVRAKEILIICGRQLGAGNAILADITGLNSSTVSRRFDSTTRRLRTDPETATLVARTIKLYKPA